MLGSFGATAGAVIATFGLEVWLSFSSAPGLVLPLTAAPLTGAVVGAVMAWLAVRWRNPLAQAGLGAGLALLATLFAGWIPFGLSPDAQVTSLAAVVSGAIIGVSAGVISRVVQSLSEADLRHVLRAAVLTALLTPIITLLTVVALTLPGSLLAPLFAPPPDPLAIDSYPPGLGVMLLGIVVGLAGIVIAPPAGALAGALIALPGAPNQRWSQMALGAGVGLIVGPVVSVGDSLTPFGFAGLPRLSLLIVAALVGGLAGLIARRLAPPVESGTLIRVSPAITTAAIGFIIAHTFFWLGPPLRTLREFAAVATPTAAPPTLVPTATPPLAPFRLSEMAVIEPGNAARLGLVSQLRGGRNGVAWSPDGELLLTTSGSEIAVHDAFSLNPIRSIPNDGAELSSLALAPDGRTLAVGNATGAVQLWEIGGEKLGVLARHSNWVSAVAFSPDGRWLASASFDHSVIVSDVAGGNEHRFTVPGQSEPAFAFSPDSNVLAVLGDDGALTAWNTTSWMEIQALNIGRAGRRLSFSPDGGLLAIGSNDGSVTLWETMNWTETRMLAGHTGGVWALSFSPDGRLLASGSADRTVRVWEVTSGAELIALSGHTSDVLRVAFSRDGRALASAQSEVLMWGVK